MRTTIWLILCTVFGYHNSLFGALTPSPGQVILTNGQYGAQITRDVAARSPILQQHLTTTGATTIDLNALFTSPVSTNHLEFIAYLLVHSTNAVNFAQMLKERYKLHQHDPTLVLTDLAHAIAYLDFLGCDRAVAILKNYTLSYLREAGSNLSPLNATGHNEVSSSALCTARRCYHPALAQFESSVPPAITTWFIEQAQPSFAPLPWCDFPSPHHT